MAYEKQTWTTGDVITQEKLNHMEDGIADADGGGVLVVNATTTTSEGRTATTLDKTWQEIYDASLTCSVIVRTMVQSETGFSGWSFAPLEAVVQNPSSSPAYMVGVYGNEEPFVANSPSDYPKRMNHQ